MTTQRALTVLQFLPLVVLALVLLMAAPVSAAAAAPEEVGVGIVVAIPGTVSLLAYLTAGVVVLGLVLARRRPVV
ncbi:MAG: hypothetical protein M3Q71_16110 [Chloroflexota bacterium]|nr:hypothetical protein [Chloroflexota bacterium]